VDVGRTQGRWFLNVAGCGFDAVVARRVNQGFRFLHGTAAYVAAVLHSLATFRPATLRLTLDGDIREERAMLCSVANARCYGGGMWIAPDARLDDGLFDLCLLREVGMVEFLRAFPRVFRGTHTTHPKVTMLRARHIVIESEPPLPVLIDGEVVGTTPAEFILAPHAISVMSPM
jgi:diacylglycerol kinase (ATP)